jgi:exodeoxyribonuclease X
MTDPFVRVLDFETTGLDPAAADVIEVGWCDVTQNGEITAPRFMLIHTNRPIEIEAMATHHILPHDLIGAANREHWKPTLAAGGPIAFIAHNARFEASFWPDAPAPWICTYKAALRLFPQAPRHTNAVLRYFLQFDSNPAFDRLKAMPPHRAAPDAYVTAHIFTRMLILENGRLERMGAWTHEPGLLPRILFGKHRGLRWRDVPPDYLKSIGRQADMDEDVRFTAAQELSRRRTPPTNPPEPGNRSS